MNSRSPFTISMPPVSMRIHFSPYAAIAAALLARRESWLPAVLLQ
jgi:hypothetical protein